MQTKTKAYLALAALCIIWGTTYIFIKFAVRDFPPFLLVGIRQTGAGIVLLTLAYFTKKAIALSPRYLLRQVVTGVATITGGNGFITWGMQYVSAGLASVIGALAPVLVVLITLFWHDRREKLSMMTIAGVLTGFLGMGLIFSDGWADLLKPEYRWGIAGCFASCFSWSLGTVMSKRFNASHISPLYNAGIQITAGGLGGFVLSALFDKHHVIHHTTQGWLSALYLLFIGSALAFSIYMFALKHLSATVSSLYTYINPVVAIFGGWIFLNESFTWPELVGAGITIAGVWLVNEGERKGNK